MARTLVIDDPMVAGLLPRLSTAAVLAHSGRSFLEHLLCTWRILSDWGFPASVCRAGLLHSAYSTSFYPHALFRLDERDTVRRMIGNEAEDLVFRFCTMDRRTCWDELARFTCTKAVSYPDRTRPGARVRIARRKLAHLLIIESANVAEQSSAADGGPSPWMSKLFAWWEFLDRSSVPLRVSVRPKLTRRADESAIDAYRCAVTSPRARAVSLLETAMERNPWAAEPRVLRALCVKRHDPSRERDLASALELNAAWALAWDKRLSSKAWAALCERIRGPSNECTSVDFESVRAILSGRVTKPAWLNI